MSRRSIPFVLAAIAIAVRLPFLHVPLDADEGGYLYVAKFWTADYRVYRDIPFDRPQGIFLIYQAILAVLGDSLPALRLGAALWNAATTLVLFRFAREVTASTVAAAGAALLFALCSTSPHLEGFIAQSELFAMLPLVLAAHFTWKERWLPAGILAGLATVIKPIGVSGFLLASGWLLYRRAGWKAAGRLVLGYGLVGAIALLHIWTIDWPGFVAQQRLKLATVAAGPAQDRFVFTIVRTAPAWVGLAVLATIGLAAGPRSVQLFGGLWVLVSLIGMQMGGEWWPHYVIQLIPALSWLTAASFAKTRTHGPSVAVALSIIIALFVARDLPLYLADPKAVAWDMTHAPIVTHQEDIAAYLQTTTQPTDTIQVAFLAPSLYALSERKATVPRFYFYEYRHSPEAYQKVAAAIRRREPAAVVWVNGPYVWATREEFRAVLDASGYQQTRDFGPILLYSRPSHP